MPTVFRRRWTPSTIELPLHTRGAAVAPPRNPPILPSYPMKKLTREDLLSLEQYAAQRTACGIPQQSDCPQVHAPHCAG